jgi:phosphoglycerate dehydrogenase-like enzyme
MAKRAHVLSCEELGPEALTLLETVAEVDVQPGLHGDALAAVIGRYDGILLGYDVQLSPFILDAAENLRVIGCTSEHLDRIDLTAVRLRGIELHNPQGGDTVAVAEQVLRLILLHADGPLSGKTLGLVGFGRTAEQVALRARAFNLRVLVNQPRLTPELAADAEVTPCDLPDLLAQADIVSLHAPFSPATAGLIGSAELVRMRPGSLLINLSHQRLIDLAALPAALEIGRPGRAILTQASQISHPRIELVPRSHAESGPASLLPLVQQMVATLRVRRPSETLSLDIVPTDLVLPHEAIDQKRVDRLREGLDQAGVLVNPPLVTPWAGRYVVLDGATRSSAFGQAGYPHIAVQLVPPDGDFTLQTWYHAISSEESADTLYAHLHALPDVVLEALPAGDWTRAFDDPRTLCYFIDRSGAATLARTDHGANRLAAMNRLVAAYTEWGNVERTLLTDLGRLLGQFPRMVAVAIFRAFTPQEVFDVAHHGQLLPAGLTRFIIPGRVLRINVPLELLKSAESRAAKRAWLNTWLANKLAHSRIRYYQEPVILIDE